MTPQPPFIPPVTRESIDAAKRAQAEERDQLFRDTGFRVTDDDDCSPSRKVETTR